MNDELIANFRKFQDSYKDKDDEDLVFLATQTIENILTQILLRFLLESPEKKDNLFDDGEAVSRFVTKIRLAQRLGLISQGVAEELQLLRKIRKEFKNKIDCTTLDYKDVRAFCKNLIAPAQLKKSAHAIENYPDTSRGDFELTVTILSVLLENILNHTKRISDAPLH